MTLVALLRHGDTAWSAEGRIQGRSDVPLSDAGRAALAAFRLPACCREMRVVTSPLSRCSETAALLGAADAGREARLAQALRGAGFQVVLVSGGAPVSGIAVDVQLAPASAADMTFRTLLDENARPVDEAWKRARAAALLDVWRALRADVLLIELFPFGRR